MMVVDKRLLWSRERAKLIFSLVICRQALDGDGEPGDRGGDEDDHHGVDLQVEQVVDHEGDKLAPASHCQLTRLISFTSLSEKLDAAIIIKVSFSNPITALTSKINSIFTIHYVQFICNRNYLFLKHFIYPLFCT